MHVNQQSQASHGGQHARGVVQEAGVAKDMQL